ncbi:MAG: Hsp20/alpha crystallin family protein [Bacillota bacterium]|nr:Hsp20/alpha crystallin family protein [Bacillota bacterium]
MRFELSNRYEPWELIDPFLDSFFDGKRKPVSRNMETDIEDKGDHYELSVNLPGWDKKNINLSLDEGYLTVTAKLEKDENNEDKETKFVRRERFYGTMCRSYFVGDIEQEDIKASFENGVLTITVPKEDNEKIAKKKEIAIQ